MGTFINADVTLASKTELTDEQQNKLKELFYADEVYQYKRKEFFMYLFAIANMKCGYSYPEESMVQEYTDTAKSVLGFPVGISIKVWWIEDAPTDEYQNAVFEEFTREYGGDLKD